MTNPKVPSGVKLLALFVAVVTLLTSLALLRAGGPSTEAVAAVASGAAVASQTETVPADDTGADLLADPQPAPGIALTDQDGDPYTLGSVPVGIAAVFFGF